MGIRFATPVTSTVDAVPRWTGEIHEGRMVYVVEVDVGALPDSTTKLVPHGLAITTVLAVTGEATDGVHTISF